VRVRVVENWKKRISMDSTAVKNPFRFFPNQTREKTQKTFPLGLEILSKCWEKIY